MGVSKVTWTMQEGPTMQGRLLAVADVVVESDRHVEKWGVQSHAQAIWLAILGEEYGEVAKAVCEIALAGRGGYDVSNLRDELIHVAAVAVSAVECLDRVGFAGQ